MDYYSILGVPRTSSQEEIRKAYKKMSMKHHPDRGGDEEQFKKINEAYQTLSDAQKRAAYDNPQPGFSFRSEDFSQGNPFSGTPFEHMFNTGFGPRSRTPRNRDIAVSASIDLKEACTGKNVFIQYRLASGKTETVTVDIPPGANHGDTIRYEGLGDDGNPRYPRGDLHVKVKISKVKNWERDGDNLLFKKDVNVFDLLLGCVIIIQTLDNRSVQLTIPKGTKPGTTFNITGYGIPNVHTGRKGNLYVKIASEIPKVEDEDILNDIEQIRNKIYKRG